MKNKKEFDAVKMMRDIRDKIDKDIEGMTHEEMIAYFNKGHEEFARIIGRAPKNVENSK